MTISLTDRERSILNLIADGLTNKEIARHLKISVRTVENHRFNIGKRMGKTRRQDFVALARTLASEGTSP